jgi:hypothetical protein
MDVSEHYSIVGPPSCSRDSCTEVVQAIPCSKGFDHSSFGKAEVGGQEGWYLSDTYIWVCVLVFVWVCAQVFLPLLPVLPGFPGFPGVYPRILLGTALHTVPRHRFDSQLQQHLFPSDGSFAFLLKIKIFCIITCHLLVKN